MSEHYPGGFSLAKRVAAASLSASALLGLSGCTTESEPNPELTAVSSYSVGELVAQVELPLCEISDAQDALGTAQDIPDSIITEAANMVAAAEQQIATTGDSFTAHSEELGMSAEPGVTVAPIDNEQAVMHVLSPNGTAFALVHAYRPNASQSPDACIAASATGTTKPGTTDVVQVTFGTQILDLPYLLDGSNPGEITEADARTATQVANALSGLVATAIKVDNRYAQVET